MLVIIYGLLFHARRAAMLRSKKVRARDAAWHGSAPGASLPVGRLSFPIYQQTELVGGVPVGMTPCFRGVTAAALLKLKSWLHADWRHLLAAGGVPDRALEHLPHCVSAACGLNCHGPWA